MFMNSPVGELFDGALNDCRALVDKAADADFRLPTPCAEWDLAALLGHMIGQNHGFARAIEEGESEAADYEPPLINPLTVRSVWATSTRRLRAAFAGAQPDAVVCLVELRKQVDVEQALRMQVLDIAVHGWDIATTLRLPYRPNDEIITFVADFSREIAARPGGTPGVFDGPLPITAVDRWADALRLLGRDPYDIIPGDCGS